MKKLYLTEMAPNGTNDLLITENGKITGCILEATVGYPGSFRTKPDAVTKETTDRVTSLKGFRGVEDTLLYHVDTNQVLEYLTSGPDAEGSPVLDELSTLGFQVPITQ